MRTLSSCSYGIVAHPYRPLIRISRRTFSEPSIRPHAASETMREVMRHVAQPTAVVTTRMQSSSTDTKHDYGATVSSFCSLSLAPIIVGFSFQQPSRMSALLSSFDGQQRREASVYLLSEGQARVARTFARLGHAERGSAFNPGLFEELQRDSLAILRGRIGVTYIPDQGFELPADREAQPSSHFHLLQVDEASWRNVRPLLWWQRSFYGVGSLVDA